ncbi:MAG: hypothetical protein PF445_02670 [Melioribacteraceae bacterium]|nr:hypothetical protein [Melioribacteraceae bacterium]
MKYINLFILILTTSLFSQTLNQNSLNDSVDDFLICSDWSLDIPSSNWGLSFGNSKNFNGFRFNYRDCDVETINGFNLTMWDAKSITDSQRFRVKTNI